MSRRAALRRQLLRLAPGARRSLPAALPTGAEAGEANALMAPAARVLLVRPDHVGDMLLCGPALARLRRARPAAEVTLLAGPWSAPLATRLPGVDSVRTLAFPYFDRQPKRWPLAPYVRLWRAVRRLDATRYDVGIVLREDDYWSAWLLALAGLPVRLGHDHPTVRPFLTHVLPRDNVPPHRAAASAALVSAALGGRWTRQPPTPATDPLRFRLSDDDHRRAAELLRAAGLGPDDRPLAVHPGAGAVVKRWRSGAWAELVGRLTAPGAAVVVTGGPDERALADAVTGAIEAIDRRAIDVAGRTDLPTLGALYRHCGLVVGPDSGPLHLAVAVGTPTVHLYGPADPARYGPWGDTARHAVVRAALPCVPCGRLDWAQPEDHPCVRTLTVRQVQEAVASCDGIGRKL